MTRIVPDKAEIPVRVLYGHSVLRERQVILTIDGGPDSWFVRMWEWPITPPLGGLLVWWLARHFLVAA